MKCDDIQIHFIKIVSNLEVSANSMNEMILFLFLHLNYSFTPCLLGISFLLINKNCLSQPLLLFSLCLTNFYISFSFIHIMVAPIIKKNIPGSVVVTMVLLVVVGGSVTLPEDPTSANVTLVSTRISAKASCSTSLILAAISSNRPGSSMSPSMLSISVII